MPLIEAVQLTKHCERRRPPRRPWELLRRRPTDKAVDSVLAVDDVSLSVDAGERCVFWRLTGRENLRLFGRLVFMDGNAIRRRTDELMQRLGLAERTDELVESYSTGMKQRLNLARTLLHDPPVLLLDEPTAALDPAAARATRGFVDELRREGKAILLTTHNMHEADAVCDRVGIIEHGRLIAEGRPADLIKRAGVEPPLELMLRGDSSAATLQLARIGWIMKSRQPHFFVSSAWMSTFAVLPMALAAIAWLAPMPGTFNHSLNSPVRTTTWRR